MRILVADDDPISRRLLEKLLAKWDFDIASVSNGRDAWEILQRSDAPRLAIIDWMMPEMDGVEVCTRVRERNDPNYTYLILLTAKNQQEDIVQGLAAGADDYITKPFDSSELSARLRTGRRILDLQSDLLSTRESLRIQATHDPLTGLPNRLLFGDRLTQQLALANRHNKPLAVMFLDLDRFKLINDTLGHNIGDLLLRGVASRLTNTLRDMDTVARMGGDEFTLILPEIGTSVDAMAAAHRVLEVLGEPFQLEGNELFISASMGISIFPSHGVNAEALVRNADTAMYQAKEHGRNNCQLFTEALNATAVERMTLECSLRKALECEELLLHYQPKVEMVSGCTIGAEALVRWKNPLLGLVCPSQFIPLAEETGLIIPIGRWVLRTACAQVKAWHDTGIPPISVSVNISACQLSNMDFIDTVKEALYDTGLDSQYLKLELTESALMKNPDVATELLNRLRNMGVGVSIDDFGTGYSSLSYLKRFPIDEVKIDRSFVRDITTNADDAAIAGAIIAMAHSLKLRVVAEGVETLDQLEFLRSLGCDDMQGYFISQPLPSDEFIRQLWAFDLAQPLREAV